MPRSNDNFEVKDFSVPMEEAETKFNSEKQERGQKLSISGSVYRLP